MKVDRSAKKFRVRQCSVAGSAVLQAVRRCRRCSVAGGAVLQAVRHCRWCAITGSAPCCKGRGAAGGEQVPPAPQGGLYPLCKKIAFFRGEGTKILQL